jgi:hypothetical protein
LQSISRSGYLCAGAPQLRYTNTHEDSDSHTKEVSNKKVQDKSVDNLSTLLSWTFLLLTSFIMPAFMVHAKGHAHIHARCVLLPCRSPDVLSRLHGLVPDNNKPRKSTGRGGLAPVFLLFFARSAMATAEITYGGVSLTTSMEAGANIYRCV